MARILAAADALATRGSFGPKARAMGLLLRYSGLRMQDAACLERARLQKGRLFLFTAEDGYAGLLSDAAQRLRGSPSCDERQTAFPVKCSQGAAHLLWAGTRIDSAIPSLSRVLLKGVSLESASKLLGHTSLKITERRYATWVKAQEDQLEIDVRRTLGTELTPWRPLAASRRSVTAPRSASKPLDPDSLRHSSTLEL